MVNKKNMQGPRTVWRLKENSPFQIKEAYKLIRTNLLFSMAVSKSKTVVISSSLPREGKSTTGANLAITMAQTGARVLLIDADLRKPTQHKIFKLNNTKGLSRVLVEVDRFEDALHKNAEPNLDVITSGPLPPNPSELLGSENMQRLLEKLEDQYDFILIDSPPINVVSDALVLSVQTAGVLLVARQKQTTYEQLQKAIESVEFANSNIVGLVITDVRERNRSYYYKNYRYGYGEENG